MGLDLAALGKGILLGLGAAAPIGPVNLEIARRTLRHGFRPGFALGCGAVTIDVSYAVLTSLSLRPALDHPDFLRVIGVLGGLFLAYLAAGSFSSAVKTMKLRGEASGSEIQMGTHTNYVTGLLMTALNPMTLLFWFVAVPGIVGQITTDPRRDLPLVCTGVFIAALAWVCSFAGLISIVGRRKNERLLRGADVVGGLLLLGFAVTAIWRAARG